LANPSLKNVSVIQRVPAPSTAGLAEAGQMVRDPLTVEKPCAGPQGESGKDNRCDAADIVNRNSRSKAGRIRYIQRSGNEQAFWTSFPVWNQISPKLGRKRNSAQPSFWRRRRETRCGTSCIKNVSVERGRAVAHLPFLAPIEPRLLGAVYWATSRMKDRPLGVPMPVTLSQPRVTTRDVSVPKLRSKKAPSP
jgi:hypothetical protein